MTRVFILAPTPVMRAGLRAMLVSADIQVVGEASGVSGQGVDISNTEVLLVADEDVLVDVAPALTSARRPALVVLSEHDQLVAVLRALPLRGWGIVPPEAPASELQAAVHAAAQGLVVLLPSLADRLVGHRSALEAGNFALTDEPLTAREREVLELLSQGLSNKLIARRLTISEHTVKFHVSSLYSKLGASSRAEAVSQGARRGLITF